MLHRILFIVNKCAFYMCAFCLRCPIYCTCSRAFFAFLHPPMPDCRHLHGSIGLFSLCLYFWGVVCSFFFLIVVRFFAFLFAVILKIFNQQSPFIVPFVLFTSHLKGPRILPSGGACAWQTSLFLYPKLYSFRCWPGSCPPQSNPALGPFGNVSC